MLSLVHLLLYSNSRYLDVERNASVERDFMVAPTSRDLYEAQDHNYSPMYKYDISTKYRYRGTGSEDG